MPTIGSMTRMTTSTMTDPTEDSQESSRRRTGTRIPARAQIMGWLLLVLVVVLLAVILLTRQFLHTDVLNKTSAALEQQAREFIAFAEQGRDPATGRALDDPHALFETFLSQQYPDSEEALVGTWRTPRGPRALSQEQSPAVEAVAQDRAVLQRLLDDPRMSGRTETAHGTMHWVKIRADTERGPAWFITERFTGQDTANADRTVRLITGVSAVGVVLAAVASWIIAGLILAPVRDVRRTAAEISEHDLTRRIPVQGRDDIAALAEQFNAMLDRLQDAFATQRQFVDDVSHELRTPITIVRGNLELLGDDPVERQEVVRLCTDELDRMTRIVEDLLVLAKAERPDFATPATVSLAELTSDVETKIRTLGDRRWVLEHLGEGAVVVDEQRVTQAMVQLAQNAVQHTEAGSEIRIGSRLRQGAALLWITDHGPGIDPERAERIFERFTHDGPHPGGAGLGLAIVRAIADAHRGRVRVWSRPGEGATFTLELPVAGPDEREEEPQRV